VVISPPPQEKIGSRLPDPAKRNHDIKLYVDALRSEAEKRKLVFFDLFSPPQADAQSPSHQPLTNNGIHFTNFGYWLSARVLERGLVHPTKAWLVELNKDGSMKKIEGAQLSKIQTGPLQFQGLDQELPAPVPPLESGMKKQITNGGS